MRREAGRGHGASDARVFPNVRETAERIVRVPAPGSGGRSRRERAPREGRVAELPLQADDAPGDVAERVDGQERSCALAGVPRAATIRRAVSGIDRLLARVDVDRGRAPADWITEGSER